MEKKVHEFETVISSNSAYAVPELDANVDLKLILSIHTALQYISKYASKAEPQSLAFIDIFNQILNNSDHNDSLLTSI